MKKKIKRLIEMEGNEEMVNCELCGERIKKDNAVDDGCSNYYCSWCVKNEGIFR